MMRYPMNFTLPWPPSVNRYWQRTAMGMRQSDAAKAYHLEVLCLVRAARGCVEPVDGSIAARVLAYPPNDKRKRDLDNILKALFDALQHAGVYKDDNQVVYLSVERCEPRGNGELEVELTTWGG